MKQVFLGLGTNLGHREQNLEQAREALKNFSVLKRASSIYETDAWGYEDQPQFLNQVLEIETDFSPYKLLCRIKKIEKEIGRVKSFRWGPRLIDIDILFYDQGIIRLPFLTIPHKSLHERAFVLVPLAEIAPDYKHPAFRLTITELRDNLPKLDGVKKWISS